MRALAICGVADVNAAAGVAASGGRPAARRLPQQRPDPPRAAPQDRADRHPMSARPPAAYVRQRQPRRRCRSREAGSAWQGAPVYRLSASTACSRLLRSESPQMKGSRQNQHGPRPAKNNGPEHNPIRPRRARDHCCNVCLCKTCPANALPHGRRQSKWNLWTIRSHLLP